MGKNSMVRAKINYPTKHPSDLGYQAECEFALEPSVSMLVDEAVASGWQLRDVACAIIFMAAQRLSNSKEKDVSDSLYS